MKKSTTRNLLVFGLSIFSFAVYSQNVAINTSGTPANASAILDLSNVGNMAFLAPQVSLTNVTALAPVPGPGPAGLLVYNTNAAVTGGNGIGYYSWYSARWNFLGGSAGTVTGANSGTSLNGTNVILGNAYGQTVGQLLANTEIPFNGFNIDFSGTTGKVGIDLAASTTAAQALEIGQTNNTIRVNGLKAGSTFNVAPAATTTYMLYANTNGDIYSMPAGATNNVLTWTATGPAWGSTSGTAWQITGNTGIVASTSAINAAANNNFIGTTTGADFVLAANNFERMRIASGGNVGFSNIAPTTMVQIGNAGTTTGKLSVYSQDSQFGQIQIGNPNANSEASMQFISNVSTFGSAAASASGTSYSWNIGVGTYGKGGQRFIISNLQYGEIMTFTNAGYVGIGNTMTNPAQELELGGTALTARIDGLNAAGTVYNQASATNVGNLVYANNVTGDLWAVPHSATQSVLSSTAAGVISWQTGTVFGGSGTADYLARWTPNGTSLGIGVTHDNGTAVSINSTATAPVNTQMLTVLQPTNTSYAIVGQNTAGSAANSGSGIYGSTIQSAGFGTWGVNTNGTGTGVVGIGDNAGGLYAAAGSGGAFTGNGIGSISFAKSGTGTGVVGAGNNGGFVTLTVGSGGAFTGTSAGGLNFATNGTGIGVYGVGNNSATIVGPASGAGGAFTGNAYGSASYATTVASGIGVMGNGNNTAGTITGNGAGGNFTGTSNGSFNFASSGTGTGVIGLGNNTGYAAFAVGAGGVFEGTSYGLYARSNAANNPSGAIETSNAKTGNTVYVNYYNGTNYKIMGTSPGTVSCSVLDTKGNSVIMHAPETPEAYYEDYGQGQLINGKVHIDLDPTYAKNICVSDKHPLRVFIQLEGDCKGVYVTNKTATGFDVVELNGGTSNISFQYHLIGNMADAMMPSGAVSKFADLRFEPTPKPEKEVSVPLQQVESAANSSLTKSAPVSVQDTSVSPGGNNQK